MRCSCRCFKIDCRLLVSGWPDRGRFKVQKPRDDALYLRVGHFECVVEWARIAVAVVARQFGEGCPFLTDGGLYVFGVPVARAGSLLAHFFAPAL